MTMLSRRDFTAVSLAFCASAIVPFGARAQDFRNDATGLVEKFAQTGIAEVLGAKISQKEKTEKFRVLFKDFFDIPAIGRFVLGRSARAGSADEMAKFATLFEDVIVYTWSRRFGEYKGQTLKVNDSAPDGDEGAVVNSTILGNEGGNFAVAWRLRKRTDGFRVVDVIIEGVSMAITYRQEYATIIQQNGGVSGLIAQMEKQVADLRAKLG
ncbi:MAG: ABC transporter substrate-binding protein [Rhodospirillaceae bacterium]|nr:ABC transporter substrate-binding protein [Rhodospirillaceae bacterium]